MAGKRAPRKRAPKPVEALKPGDPDTTTYTIAVPREVDGLGRVFQDVTTVTVRKRVKRPTVLQQALATMNLPPGEVATARILDEESVHERSIGWTQIPIIT